MIPSLAPITDPAIAPMESESPSVLVLMAVRMAPSNHRANANRKLLLCVVSERTGWMIGTREEWPRKTRIFESDEIVDAISPDLCRNLRATPKLRRIPHRVTDSEPDNGANTT